MCGTETITGTVPIYYVELESEVLHKSKKTAQDWNSKNLWFLLFFTYEGCLM
jgi:hypothetical protein